MRLIVSWFQALFTSLSRYFSAFARATSALSVSGRIQNWKSVPPSFPRDIQRAVLGIPPISQLRFAYGTFTLYGLPFQARLASEAREYGGPLLHISRRSSRRDSVCSRPFSIAFTHGISVDFLSSPY